MKKKLLYIGIDQSLKATGLVFFIPPNTSKTHLITTSPNEEPEPRIYSIWLEILTSIKANYKENVRLRTIAIEGLAFGATGSRKDQLAGLHFYLRMKFYLMFRKQKQAPLILIVPPTTLKKYVTGKGNSQKNLMILHCFKKFNFSAPDDDICDAYCLARYAQNLDLPNY